MGIKKDLFYYSVLSESDKRGYNQTIVLFVLRKDYSPIQVGECHVNTGSYKGVRGTVNTMIHKVFGYKMRDGYSLVKSIKTFQI